MIKAFGILGVCAAVFGASFAGTFLVRTVQSNPHDGRGGSPLARLLELDEKAAGEIEGLDSRFTEELDSMRQALAEARAALATMLEDANVTNEAIREQIETCIARHNELERRVADYVLSVREHLSPAQQQKLLRRCAEGVRKRRGQGWRGERRGEGRCECCGRGGGGRGRGPGAGEHRGGQHDD